MATLPPKEIKYKELLTMKYLLSTGGQIPNIIYGRHFVFKFRKLINCTYISVNEFLLDFVNFVLETMSFFFPQ